MKETENPCRVWFFVTPWTVYMEFSMPQYWSGYPSPSPGNLSNPGIKTQVFHTAGRFFTSWATREAQENWSEQPIPSPEDLPSPEIRIRVSCIASGFFTNWAIREAPFRYNLNQIPYYYNVINRKKKKDKVKQVCIWHIFCKTIMAKNTWVRKCVKN